MTKLKGAALALVVALWAAPAAAQEYAGVVKTVKGSATVEHAGRQTIASPGTHLFQGDRVLTGSNGYVGLTMRDDTLLTLGPGSNMTLDRYAFDPKTHEGSFLASLGKGVMSVVTGLIARKEPDNFAVKTRVSTMGVRGTEFIIEANEE